MNKNFFGEYISTIKTKDSDDQYAFHNFSGEHSASNPRASSRIYDIINAFFPKKGKMCDIGAANGFFAQEFQMNGWDAYGIDGCDYGWNKNNLHIDKSKYCIFDMCESLNDYPQLEKMFDLTTAIEITEHVSEEKIKSFFDNVSFISKSCFCSIHYGGKEEANHYNIKSIEWWKNFLSQYGVVKIIEPTDEIKHLFGESVFALILFKKGE